MTSLDLVLVGKVLDLSELYFVRTGYFFKCNLLL
jgi:hypothetical protein